MKKIAGIEIIIIIVTLMILVLAPINAYRISTTFVGLESEQSYIYESAIYGVTLTLFCAYLVVHIKYKMQDYPRAFILIRLYPSLLLSLYAIVYIFGLNYGSYKGLEDAFTYQMLVPLWAFALINVLFMVGNVFLLRYIYLVGKYKKLINVYAIVLTVFYIVMFSAVITDSAMDLGLSEWD